MYYKFQESAATQSSGIGTNVPKSEGSYQVSPADKMIEAWNFFSEEAYEMLNFLRISNIGTSQVYPEFDYYQFNEARRFSRRNNYLGL